MQSPHSLRKAYLAQYKEYFSAYSAVKKQAILKNQTKKMQASCAQFYKNEDADFKH